MRDYPELSQRRTLRTTRSHTIHRRPHQFDLCEIILASGLTAAVISSVAISATTVIVVNSVGNAKDSYRLANWPPRKLPTEGARNHTPITSPALRAGASRVMALRPMGLRHSSPTVCSR